MNTAANGQFAHTSLLNLRIVALVMVVLYAASQFLTQRMMLTKNTNLDKSMPNPMMQSQKIMLYAMPIGMLFFGLSVQIGVVLYLMTTNVWTIGQQFYTLRNSPVPGSQAEKEMIARRKAKEAKKALAAAGNGPVSNAVSAADGKAQDLPRSRTSAPSRSVALVASGRNKAGGGYERCRRRHHAGGPAGRNARDQNTGELLPGAVTLEPVSIEPLRFARRVFEASMTVPTRIAALPELEERFVRRSLWVLGCWVMLLYVLWEAWELYAPWRTQAFLHAAGFRGVSFGAAQESTQRSASLAPLLVAVDRVRRLWSRHGRHRPKDPRHRRTGCAAGDSGDDRGHDPGRRRTRGEPGPHSSRHGPPAERPAACHTIISRRHRTPCRRQRRRAGKRGLQPCGAPCPPARTSAGARRRRLETTGTVYGVDTVTGKAFTASHDQKLTYIDGPR